MIALALTAVALVAGPPRPAIVQKPIPFGPQRRAEMAAYSKRHYGTAQWRLTAPKVIVEHYTVSDTFASAYNTFAPDRADSELHELPGTCAHFVIDKDGTIYQLVPLTIALPPHRRAQLHGDRHRARRPLGRAASSPARGRSPRRSSSPAGSWRASTSLRKNVIGHAESLSSPYHHELVPRLRTQTHGDWTAGEMAGYRKLL